MLQEQGSAINPGGVNALSADWLQRTENVDAALQHSTATAFTAGPKRLSKFPEIIPKKMQRASVGGSNMYTAKSQCKIKN